VLGTFRDRGQVSVCAAQPPESHRSVPVIEVVPEQTPRSASRRPVVVDLVVSRVDLLPHTEGLGETADQPGAVGEILELIGREISGVSAAQLSVCLRPNLASTCHWLSLQQR
jgi:hypothetical protein